MDAVNKAKGRLRKYPTLVVQCHKLASEYAVCVMNQQNLKKDDCVKEFEKFKSCLVKAAAQNKTKL